MYRHNIRRDAASRSERMTDSASAELLHVLGRMGLRSPGDIGAADVLTSTAVNLVPGVYRAFRMEGADSHLYGFGAGVYADGNIALSTDNVIVEGIWFRALDRVDRYLVDVLGTTRAIFRACTFEKAQVGQTLEHVRVANGARAVFTNCRFIGWAPAQVISNLGIPTDVHVHASHNGTGSPIGVVTVAGVI